MMWRSEQTRNLAIGNSILLRMEYGVSHGQVASLVSPVAVCLQHAPAFDHTSVIDAYLLMTRLSLMLTLR